MRELEEVGEVRKSSSRKMEELVQGLQGQLRGYSRQVAKEQTSKNIKQLTSFKWFRQLIGVTCNVVFVRKGCKKQMIKNIVFSSNWP